MKNFTIIIIQDDRRLCSFTFSSHLITISLISIIGFFIISLTAVLLYNTTGSFSKVELTTRNQTQTDSPEMENNKKAATIVTGTPPEQPNNLAIENFKAHFSRTKKSFRYSFLLKNRNSHNTVASGYIFVILKSEGLGQEQWLADPQKTVLANGAPQNVKDGDPFSITKHKIITKNITTQHTYDYVTIFVFSDDGNLVLKEDFDLKS